MLLVDEDVWDSRLLGLFSKVGLHLVAVRVFVEPERCGQLRRSFGGRGTYSST